MAISSSALTLPQYALQSNDPLVQRITYSLLEYGNAMADIPFANRKTLLVNGVRWEGNLPSVDWVPVNTDPVVVSGTPSTYQEQAYITRNAIDVDKALVQDENAIVDPRGAQIEAYLRAWSYDFNHKFINNNHIDGSSASFVGLRHRIDNASTFGIRSENKINANALDLTQSGISNTSANKFLELIDQLIWSLDSRNGRGCVLYMNEVMQRRFAYAMRTLGSAAFNTTRDNYDREVMFYREARIEDIGYKGDQSTRIITTTETAGGADGASTHTSIYGVHYGIDHLVGWQYEPLKPVDVGLTGNGGCTYRTVIDWTGGILPRHTRCMGRIYGIKLA